MSNVCYHVHKLASNEEGMSSFLECLKSGADLLFFSATARNCLPLLHAICLYH
jgi:hypothetical protein